MIKNKKILFIALSLFSVALLTLFAIKAIENKASKNEPVIEDTQATTDGVAKDDSDPYDPDIYWREITKYSKVILPLNAKNGDKYLADTLFVGDSNTEGIGAFEHMPMKNVLGKHSMDIQGVSTDAYIQIAEDIPETEEDESQYITMLQSIAIRQPKRIIINFGTNNAGSHAIPEQFAAVYADTLKQIESSCPKTEIVIAAILPVCKERSYPKIMQDVIDQFNLQLAQLCRENGYGFLNYPEVFKDSQTGYANADYFSADGVHLNGDGYRLLLDYAGKHQYN